MIPPAPTAGECALCGTTGGRARGPGDRPRRLDGAPVGIAGLTCIDCYRKAQSARHYRARKARDAARPRPARVRRDEPAAPCDLCGDPGGRVAGCATRPTRYDGAAVGRPGLLVCHACRYPPAADPDDLPGPDPAARAEADRARDARVRAAALAILREKVEAVEERLRLREARLLPPTLAELVAAAKARERARRSWTFGPATPVGVQRAGRRPAASGRFLNPRQRVSGERWSN